MSDGSDQDGDGEEVILDTIGDEVAREVLEAVARRPRTVKQLADVLDHSEPTIYRRINKLEEQNLVRERTMIAESGNHISVYECNFDGTIVSLGDDGYEVEVYHVEDLSDSFSQLWDEMSAGT